MVCIQNDKILRVAGHETCAPLDSGKTGSDPEYRVCAQFKFHAWDLQRFTTGISKMGQRKLLVTICGPDPTIFRSGNLSGDIEDNPRNIDFSNLWDGKSSLKGLHFGTPWSPMSVSILTVSSFSRF